MTGIPNLLDDNGMEYTTPLTKAHALNQQFSSAFSKVTPTGTATTLKDTASRLLPPPYNHMDCITITTAGISKLLCKLDPRKAPGPDNISPRALKELYFSIAPTLQVIYERSYNDGMVPYDWLHANVCPIYKKGTRKAPVNYRPISLTCIACKIFEHIVTSSVMSHLDNQAILVDNQHGFRRGRSCETQLTELTHDLLTSMHNGRQTCMIVMDFSKAFDKVYHNNNNNNNTGHLLHAISPKSKEHIACYKHITNYRYIVAKHCYSYRTLTTLCKKNTHSSNSTADKGLKKTNNNGYIQAVSRQDGTAGFKGHATRNDIVDDIVDVSSSTMAFNVAKIASARASLTISLTKSLRVAGPLVRDLKVDTLSEERIC